MKNVHDFTKAVKNKKIIQKIKEATGFQFALKDDLTLFSHIVMYEDTVTPAQIGFLHQDILEHPFIYKANVIVQDARLTGELDANPILASMLNDAGKVDAVITKKKFNDHHRQLGSWARLSVIISIALETECAERRSGVCIIR